MGMAWINNAVPGRFGINYYMCTGEDPRDYDFLVPKVSFDSTYIDIHCGNTGCVVFKRGVKN